MAEQWNPIGSIVFLSLCIDHYKWLRFYDLVPIILSSDFTHDIPELIELVCIYLIKSLEFFNQCLLIGIDNTDPYFHLYEVSLHVKIVQKVIHG